MFSFLPSGIAQLAIEIPLVLALNAALVHLYNAGKDNGPIKPINQPPYSPRRIMKTRILLSQLLPPELADLILDQAEFWRSVRTYFARHADFEQPLYVEMSVAKGNDGRRCVVLTEEIQEWIPMGVSRVRRVVFEMTSRDQGWDPAADFLPYKGPYAYSQTWFEAMTIRGFHPSTDTASTAPPEKLRSRKQIIQELEQPPENRSPEFITVKRPGPAASGDTHSESDTWHVQYNLCANHKPMKHVVVWSLGETRPDDGTELDMDGRGRGAQFLESLRAGDRIALVARAGGPLDQNIIRLAAVELFYAT